MYKYVVAGGGSGAVSVVAQLIRSGRVKPAQILVIEPSLVHYYQPGFTMVGGGLLGNESEIMKKSINILRRPTRDMFNSQVSILQKEVTGFDPDNNKVLVSEGQEISYETLIVALGMTANLDAVPGLAQAFADPNAAVASIYRWDWVLKMNRLVKEFKGGKAVFYMPPQPIKCGGAPQKVMYLANDDFHKNGVKDFKIDYYMPQPGMFGIAKYSNILQSIADKKNIGTHPEHTLVRVDHMKRAAYFKTKTGEVEVNYDLLHVAPPHKPLDVLKNSKIVDATGFVDVDRNTLKHKTYGNVWSLGDCSNLPTSKTLAAALSQTNVLVHNIYDEIDNKKLRAKYSGYTSCPIFVGGNKLLLCEFKYDGELDETFSNFIESRPHILFYWMKRYFFPFVYLNFVKRGWWFGKTTIFKPKFF